MNPSLLSVSVSCARPGYETASVRQIRTVHAATGVSLLHLIAGNTISWSTYQRRPATGYMVQDYYYTVTYTTGLFYQ